MAIAGSTRRPLRGSRPRNDNVSLRRALEDLAETSCHPLRIIAAIVALVAVVLVGRVLLRFPPLLGFCPTHLQRLSLKILFLFLLLF